MVIQTSEIADKARQIIRRCGSRDPYEIASALDVIIMERDFHRQRGAYKVIKKNRFIFINTNLLPETKRIVLLHELGHDTLHRREAIAAGGFQEFNLFDMRNNRMEYEANIFAAQIELDDEEFLEYCKQGYDAQQVASAMNSDINLVALKADFLMSQGFRLRQLEYHNDFLRYDKGGVC